MAKYIRKSVGILSKRTLSEFGQAVYELAEKAGLDYATVGVEQNISGGKVKNEFKAYVDKFTYVTAPTVEECIQKVEEMCFENKNINQEIIL